MRKALGRYVVVDSKICHGQPTFRGTRILVSDVLEQVADGVSRYTRRYQSPPPNPSGRVVVTIAVDSVITLNA